MQTYAESLQNLNPEQRRAVECVDKHLLIVAGAGTGKTQLVTTKIAHFLMNDLARANQILALAFNDDAADEMEARVMGYLPLSYATDDFWIKTFHAFGERILRENAFEVGLGNDFKVLNKTEQYLLVYRNWSRFKVRHIEKKGSTITLVKALVDFFQDCKRELITPEDYWQWTEDWRLNKDLAKFYKQNFNLNYDADEAPTMSEIKETYEDHRERAEAYALYQKILLENNAIDFSDMLFHAYFLLKTKPLIRRKYQEQFKYIIVDEFQDTDYLQYELVKMLLSGKNHLTVVGDDDQSIYRFRGASIYNILQFKEDFPEAEEVFLTTNYRSGQEVLDLSYKSIQHNNPERLEVKLNNSKRLLSKENKHSNVEVLGFNTDADEMEFLIKQIVQLSKDKEDFQWKDVAVLARTHAALDTAAKALEEAGVPYCLYSAKGLYNKNAVLDVLNYLKLLDDYHESTSMFRVLSLSIFDVPREDIIKLNHYAKQNQISLWETCKQAAILPLNDGSLEKISKILHLIEKHSAQVKDKSVGQIILNFLTDSDYLKDLLREENEQSKESLKHLQTLFEKIKKFESSTLDASLPVFIANLQLELDLGESGDLGIDFDLGPDVVSLLTAHGSKGLEFKHVFVINLVNDSFPGSNRDRGGLDLPDSLVKEKSKDESHYTEKELHLMEERRLFYVACTRAKESLFLTYSIKQRNLKRDKKPSAFLSELELDKGDLQDFGKDSLSFWKTYGAADRWMAEIKPGAEPVSALPTRYSFSKLKTYSECPYKYKLQHILRVPTKPAASLSFGQAIHQTFEAFCKTLIAGGQQTDLFASKELSSRVSKKFLLSLFDKSWAANGTGYESPQQKEEYHEKGLQIMEMFWNDYESNHPNVKEVEKQINWKWSEKVALEARLDRLDVLPDGAWRVVDYKTGRGKQKIDDNYKKQLVLYAKAMQAQYGVLPAEIKLIYVEDWLVHNVKVTEKEIASLDKWVQEILDGIAEMDYSPNPSEFNCQYCPYRDICEYKKDT